MPSTINFRMRETEQPLGSTVHRFCAPLTSDLNSALSAFSFEPPTVNRQKLEFSSHSGNLALVRKYVRRFLESYSLSEKECLLMVLGVDEACTNIIRYAYELRDDELIALTMEGFPNRIRIRLRDYGKQASRGSLKGRSHDFIRPGGLGLHLIHNAFDEVDYVKKRRGTELVLTKKVR